jgi:hypothetical protein
MGGWFAADAPGPASALDIPNREPPVISLFPGRRKLVPTVPVKVRESRSKCFEALMLHDLQFFSEAEILFLP